MHGPTLGPWRLRFLIVNTHLDSKSFLTSHGINKVATINPKGPAQELFALHVEEDWYIITPEPASLCPPGLARKEDGSVILSKQPDHWRLQYLPLNMAGGDVYEIHSKELIGAELLLGKEKHKNEVKIESFVVGYQGPKPAWQFQKY